MPVSLYRCFKCNKELNSSEVRYIGTSEKTNMVCSSCLEKLKLTKKGVTPEHEDFMQDRVSIKQEKTVPKTQYMCQNCNYIFYIRKDSNQQLLCPYCGKDRLVIKQHTV